MTEEKIETLFEDELLAVETIPLDHKIKTSGFLFREKPKAFNIDKAKLKDEILLHHIVQLKKEINQYINYYNYDRIKLNLNGMSPIQYRAHYYQN